MRVAFVIFCLLLVPVSLVPQVEPTRVASRREATVRPEIVGQRGIVAGGRHYSVHAGVRILEQGGNAVDASRKGTLIAEVFNVFNHANYGSYATSLSAANAATTALFGRPQQIDGNAYVPREAQLGFRIGFWRSILVVGK